MKKLIFLLVAGLWGAEGSAQVVALKADNWVFRPGAVQFRDSGGVAQMKIDSTRGSVVLKHADLGDGTIEFDMIPTDPNFSQLYFRREDSLESECFYFRTERGIGHPYDMVATQYTPIVKGTMYWDLLPYYQGNASFGLRTNHVKLVMNGRQLRVFVNDMERPTLEVPQMEGNTTHGTLAFSGQAIISNLVLKPGKVDGLSPLAGIDPVANDPRYLRHWQMTKPDTLPAGIDFSWDLMPGKERFWQPIDAERRGLINLSRQWVVKRSHQIVWLKTTIHADQARSCTMRLGFLDEVWMFLNGRVLYVDKNFYGRPIVKVPNGRLSLENTTVTIPLQQGDNELLVGVGSNFYGWGIMARLDDLEGITIERTADGR